MNLTEIERVTSEILKIGRKVITSEAEEISQLVNKLDNSFVMAVKKILACKGKVIVSGMGKSGLIGHKIAATLSSTGTPSLFLHPAEAYHGDMGMIEFKDIVLLISNSGETDEVLKIIPFLQDQKNVIIAMTGNTNSTLAHNAFCCLNIEVTEEACPLQLAPTSSTTATLVLGDALALAVMELRGFKEKDFARFHPGGNLGRRLVSRVENEMIHVNKLSLLKPEATTIETIHTISDSRIGVAVVTDINKKLVGIVTDGDIRRAAERNQENFFKMKAKDVLTENPRTVKPDMRIFDAENIMDSLRIHQLVVVDDEYHVVGILPYRLQINKK